MVFCLGFCFIFWHFAPENARKNSLHVRFLFWVPFSLSFRFPSSSFLFFLRDTAQVVTGHTPHAPFSSVSLFLSPPRLFLPVLAVRPFFLAFCRGAILAPGVLAFFGFSRNIGGLEITRPLLRPVLGREAAWVFIVDSLLSFLFSPFCCVLRLFSYQLDSAPPRWGCEDFSV